MKYVITFFLMSFSLFGWSKGSFLEPLFISNPYNDKEIVFSGTFSSINELYVCKVEFQSGKILNKKLPIQDAHNIHEAIINSGSKRIGYIYNGKIEIFDYNDFSKVSSFAINYADNSQDTKVSFSNDGNSIYTLKKSELRFTSYDAISGNKQNQITINANPTFYTAAYLNNDKDEFALHLNDSLEIWLISTGKIDRKIPFNSNAQMVKFRDDGNTISYKIGKIVYLVDAKSGAEIYNKQIDFEITYLDFSANLKYMVCREEEYKQLIWDIEADTLVFDNKTANQLGIDIGFLYLNSNKTKAIGFTRETMYCGRVAEMPSIVNVYHLFDMSNYERIATVSDGYIGNPSSAIINPTNDLILVSSYQSYGKNYTHGLVNGDGDFLKMVSWNKQAIAFTHDSKYIAFKDSSWILFYNIEKDTVDKILQPQGAPFGKIYFCPQNGGLMVSINKDNIDVYDYKTFNLKYSKSLTAETGYGYAYNCDINGKITIITPSEKLINFDPAIGDLTESTLNNLPQNRTLRDISNDSRFILWSIGRDSIIVYDTWRQNIKYSYKNPKIGIYSEQISMGFLGINEIVYFSYINNPMDKYNEFYGYDLVEKKIVPIPGEGYPIVSIDGTKYMTFSCPYLYMYNSIRLPVSVWEEDKSSSSLVISPNPAGEYIIINFNGINQFHINPTLKRGVDGQVVIEIYDVMGMKIQTTKVETIHELSLRKMDVSNLSPGVYFLKIGGSNGACSIVEKFVKM